MKKLIVARVFSPNGEAHYILQEPSILNRSGNEEDLSEFEIKKITKKEASKPLFLTRQE